MKSPRTRRGDDPGLIGPRSAVCAIVNPTPEIRPPLGDLADATVEAAARLLRSRLRQHLRMKAAEVERCLGPADEVSIDDLLLDCEKNVQADAGAAWITTLGLWSACWQCDDPRRWHRWCVGRALVEACEGSLAIAAMRRDAHPGHDVDGWVKEFVLGTNVEDLLRLPVGRAPLIEGGLACRGDMNPSTTNNLFVEPPPWNRPGAARASRRVRSRARSPSSLKRSRRTRLFKTRTLTCR